MKKTEDVCIRCKQKVGKNRHVKYGEIYCVPCRDGLQVVTFKEIEPPNEQKTVAKEEKSILAEAESIINGARRESYGDAAESFKRIAAGWSSLTNANITPNQVCLMTVWLKLCRESASHNRDNLVDAAGYVALASKISV